MHEIRSFLLIATRHLCRPLRSKLALETDGEDQAPTQRSSGTFTTFDDLRCDAGYYRGELPLEAKLFEDYVADNAWGSCGPIEYAKVAHVLIPRFFIQETFFESAASRSQGLGASWNQWEHEQDLEGLSLLLNKASIDHGLVHDVLEVKRF